MSIFTLILCLGLFLFSKLHKKNFPLTADVLYDLGTGLEVLSPLCPQLFLEMAGLGNFAKVRCRYVCSYDVVDFLPFIFVKL